MTGYDKINLWYIRDNGSCEVKVFRGRGVREVLQEVKETVSMTEHANWLNPFNPILKGKWKLEMVKKGIIVKTIEDV